MFDFMMPTGAGAPNELPPGLPPVPQVQLAPQMQELAQPVAPAAPVAAAVAPEVAQALPKVMDEEGAAKPSSSGDGFFDKLRTDPKLSQAMMMMGLRMMQGAKPGQNQMGVLGDAMMAGATAHNMLKYNEREQGRQDAETTMRQTESAARVKSSEASTAATLQGTEFKAQLQPDEIKKAKLEVVRLKNAGDLDAARLLGEAVKNDPEMVRRHLDDQHRQSVASANASNASASASSAHAGTALADQGYQKVLADPNATAQAKADAERALRKGHAVAGGKASDIDSRAAALRKADPSLSESAAYRKAYEDASEKKGGDMETLIKLRESVDPETAKWAEQQMLAHIKGKTAGQGQQPTAPAEDMSKWEKQGGFALRPGADRKLKSSWVQVQ